MNKLNFGCGSIQPEGWENVDIEDCGQPHIGTSTLFADGEFDIIVAHCAIQIVDFMDLFTVLSDLHRILKPGGILRISLPDIIAGFHEVKKQPFKVGRPGSVELDTREGECYFMEAVKNG